MVDIVVLAEQRLSMKSSVHPVIEKLNKGGVEEHGEKQAFEIEPRHIAESWKPRVGYRDEHQLQHKRIVSESKSHSVEVRLRFKNWR